jgi:hypothetical protein
MQHVQDDLELSGHGAGKFDVGGHGWGKLELLRLGLSLGQDWDREGGRDGAAAWLHGSWSIVQHN